MKSKENASLTKFIEPNYMNDWVLNFITNAEIGQFNVLFVSDGYSEELEMAYTLESSPGGIAMKMNANDNVDATNKLTSMIVDRYSNGELSLELAKRIVGYTVDLIITLANMNNGGKRIDSIIEVDYDFENKEIKFNPIMIYSVESDKFDFVGKLSEDKIEKMIRRGVKEQDICNHIN